VTLDLEGVHFSAGVNFIFAAGTSLLPGERILVVLDEAAFEAVHGTGRNVAGEFQNNTRLNNGSDRIVLDDATNSTIAEFNYNDNPPWPTGPDGGGFSLVLADPVGQPDPDEASSWRESTTVGGNPGGTDSSVLAGLPDEDLDRDGLSALLEHALGTSDLVPNSAPLAVSANGDRMRVALQVNLAADDASASLEYSPDLAGWADASPVLPLFSFTNNADGTATLVFESGDGFLSAGGHGFVRVRAEQSP
jgi:hypothetical protein